MYPEIYIARVKIRKTFKVSKKLNSYMFGIFNFLGKEKKL